jgi:hypothetical protein
MMRNRRSGDLMYPVQYRELPVPDFFRDAGSYLEERIPTFEGMLDDYIEAHFDALIQRTGLIRQQDLAALETRLATVSGEVERLARRREEAAKRLSAMEARVSELEAGHA